MRIQVVPGHVKDSLKHRLGQPAGLGILLARMIRGYQYKIGLQNRDLPVPETGPGDWERNVMRLQGIQAGPEGDLAQRYDDPHLPEQCEFLQEEGATALKLDWGRLVVWWGASDSGRNIAIREVKAIVAVG